MNALTTIPEPAPAPMVKIRSLDDYIRLGEIFGRSGLFADARDANKCVVKILAGAEMGFGPLASMTGVHVIEGKPCVGAHMMAAAIKRSGRYDYRVIESTRERCEVEFLEHGKPAGRVSLTMREATDTGLALGKEGKVKANWARHSDAMLFARCISSGFKRFCPDLIGGIAAYDPDEMDGQSQVEPALARNSQPHQVMSAVVSQPVSDTMGLAQADDPTQYISNEQYQQIVNAMKSNGHLSVLGVGFGDFARRLCAALGVERGGLIPREWFDLAMALAKSAMLPEVWRDQSFKGYAFSELSEEDREAVLSELDNAQAEIG